MIIASIQVEGCFLSGVCKLCSVDLLHSFRELIGLLKKFTQVKNTGKIKMFLSNTLRT